MASTASKLVAVARKQIGVVEVPVNLVKYNTWYYKKAVHGAAYPWCDAFVSWCGNESGNSDIIHKSVSTIAHKARFQRDGVWHSKTGFTPKAGDLVFFNFGGRPAGVPEHIGIVESYNAKTKILTTIEGNTSTVNQRNGGMVMRRYRALNCVVGFARPKYEKGIISVIPKPVVKKPVVKKPVVKKPVVKKFTLVHILKRGMHGANVKKLQKRIGVLVDGDFGKHTEAVVKKFQKKHKLVADGIVEAATAKALGWNFKK